MTRLRFSQTLSIDSSYIVCNQCSHRIADAGQPWKAGACLTEMPVRLLPGTGSGVEQHVVLRRFSCPSCGGLLDTETALPGDPFLDDVLDVAGANG